MSIELDTERYKQTEIFAQPETAIRLSDMPYLQKSAIERTAPLAKSAIAQIELPNTYAMQNAVSKDITSLNPSPVSSSAARAGIAGFTEKSEEVQQLEEVERRLLEESVKAAQRNDKPRSNYLIEMSKLVGQITALLTQWSNQDSHRMQKKKIRYEANSKVLEKTSYTKAKINGAASMVAVIGNLAAGYLGYQDASILLNQINNVQGVFINCAEGKSLPPSQKNNLVLQEFAKGGSGDPSANRTLEDSSRQLLGEIRQWMQKAVSSQ